MRHLLVVLCFFQVVFAAEIVVEPKEAMVDETIVVKVIKAPPRSSVKVMATMQDEGGRAWKSSAVFVSNENGEVDVTKMAPCAGSYNGVDPMGLFWSMALTEKEKDRTLFRQKGSQPIEVSLAAHLDGGRVIFGKVVRKVAKDGVTRTCVSEEGVVGNLFLPEGEGPFPTVIVLGGAGGGLPFDAYVAQFANKGYAALGLAYFFAPNLPEHMYHIPVETMGKAIAWLKKQKKVDANNLSVIGTSMGGVYALLSASYYPAIKSVVVFDGAGHLFQSLDSGKSLSMPVSPFAFEEKPLPFVPLRIPEQNAENFKTSFFLRTFLGSYFEMPKEKREEAAIKVEKINGRILLMGTLDDQLFGSGHMLHEVYNRLVTHQFPYPFDFVAYKGAGHVLGMYGLPNVPTTSSTMQLRQNKMICELGGNPKDMNAAQIDSWKRTFAFLKGEKQ